MSQSAIRTCVLTGEEKDPSAMIRLVQGPDGVVVPDLAEKLPGRGVWVTASGALLRQVEANAKELLGRLNRGFKTGTVKIGEQPLSEQIAQLLERKCLAQIGLERKKGALIPGMEKVKATLKRGDARALFIAQDAADDSLSSLLALQQKVAPKLPIVRLFDREQLAQALGREIAVFLVWTGNPSKGRFWLDMQRLEQFRQETVSKSENLS